MARFFAVLPHLLLLSLFHEEGERWRTRRRKGCSASFPDNTAVTEFLRHQVLGMRCACFVRVDVCVYNSNCVLENVFQRQFSSVPFREDEDYNKRLFPLFGCFVHCWFLRNAAKMELVRYDCDYRAYKRTFNASTRSKFAKGMPPHGNKGFSSAFFVFGEVSLSLSLARY